MAGCTDYRVQVAWVNHPKRKKLERKLGRSGVLAVMDLWGFCASSRTNGDLSGMSNEDIGIAAGYDGDADEFMKTLSEVGLIDGQDGSWAIHDLVDHNPWVAGAVRRSEAARAAINSRWAKERKKIRGVSSRSTERRNRNTPSPSPSPSPSPHVKEGQLSGGGV